MDNRVNGILLEEMNDTVKEVTNRTTFSCFDPTLCFTFGSNENVPLAFDLTIAAGLPTVIGAIPPVIPCIKHTNRKLLSASLASVAGVMIYVSFTEILSKADSYFCCLTETHHRLAALCCFFGGIVLTAIINILVHWLETLDRRYDFKKILCRHCTCRNRKCKSNQQYYIENNVEGL